MKDILPRKWELIYPLICPVEISQCRDAVVSRYMVHHVRNHTKAKKGDRLHRHSVSKGFLQARRRTDLTWERNLPAYHEIRSLAGRLYNDQGIDVQSLLGHADPKTTAMYRDSRGAEWVSVG